MENQPKSLPGAGSIISDSWKLFTSTWKTTFKTSSLFIYIGLAYLVAGILSQILPLLSFTVSAISIVSVIFTTWIDIRLVLMLLKLEAGEQPLPVLEESKKAWSLFWPILAIGVLNGLFTLGAMFLFIAPGVYFSVAFAFGKIILIDQDTGETKALRASQELIRGRWLSTLWRLFACGFVFGLLILVVALLLLAVIGIISSSLSVDVKQAPIILGAMQMFEMVIVAAALPLMTSFQIKLYRQLQKTR